MRFIGYSAYLLAAATFAQQHAALALVSFILMGWLVMLTRCQQQLIPNEGPWNEAEALDLSFTVLPTMTIGLSLFGPVYASWALSMGL